MKTKKLIPMIQFILEIDWMTTVEFCDAYQIPHPFFTGDVKTSADQFISLDAIKHKMFVEHAKLLNKNITADILIKNLGFEAVDVSLGSNFKYKNGKYIITNDEFGFWLEPYDSVDGCRVHKLNDLSSYDLTYSDRNLMWMMIGKNEVGKAG